MKQNSQNYIKVEINVWSYIKLGLNTWNVKVEQKWQNYFTTGVKLAKLLERESKTANITKKWNCNTAKS